MQITVLIFGTLRTNVKHTSWRFPYYWVVHNHGEQFLLPVTVCSLLFIFVLLHPERITAHVNLQFCTSHRAIALVYGVAPPRSGARRISAMGLLENITMSQLQFNTKHHSIFTIL